MNLFLSLRCSRVWRSGVRTLAPLLGFTTIGLATAPAQALDRLELQPQFLLEEPLPFGELEAFAQRGEKSSNLQFLLDLITSATPMTEGEIQSFLGNPSPVNGALMERFLQSTIGTVLLQEVMGVLQPDPDPEAWRSLQAAMIAAVADNESSVIEVLKNYQPTTLLVDLSRVSKIQNRVNQDIEDLQGLLGLTGSGSFNDGVKGVFCGSADEEAAQLIDLLVTLTASGQDQVADVLDEDIPADPALLDRFLESFFGEIFLRHLALDLDRTQTDSTTLEALKRAISEAAADGQFSINEALANYQPNQDDRYRATLLETITAIQGDISAFQSILGLEGPEDVNHLVRTLVCEEETQTPLTTPSP